MATSVAPLEIPAHVPVREGAPSARRLRAVAPAPELTITISDAWEDVDEGLRVVHDGFVEAGYMEPQPSGRRFIAQYLNPGTVFIVARLGDEPAGVIAVIPDGPFGLPSDRAFREEIDAFRTDGRPLFEAGSMVVRHSARRHTRRVVGGLIAASFLVLSESPGFRVVMSIEPRQVGFYDSLLNTVPVSEPRPLFGAPAVLIEGEGPRAVQAMFTAGSNGQRMVQPHVLEPDSGWRRDTRGGEPWPEAEVASLLTEQGGLGPFLGQLGLVARMVPGLLAGV